MKEACFIAHHIYLR